MKKLLMIALLCSSAFSLDVLDGRIRVIALMNIYLPGSGQVVLPPSLPEDLGYNNGNQKFSPGELVYATDNIFKYPTSFCYVEKRTDESAEWVSQKEYQSYVNLDNASCLYGSSSIPDEFEQCFVAILPNTLDTFSRSRFMAINKFTPPGTKFLCSNHIGQTIRFEVND